MNREKPEIPVLGLTGKSSGRVALFLNGKIKTGKTESFLYTKINIKKSTHTPHYKYFSLSLSSLNSVFPFPFQTNHSADLNRKFDSSGLFPVSGFEVSA